MVGAMCRTPEEWYAHPQGEILAQTPLIEILQIGDSEPELSPLTNAKRPLSGIIYASLRGFGWDGPWTPTAPLATPHWKEPRTRRSSQPR